jgi:DNA-binding transcriptional regulator YiaG
MITTQEKQKVMKRRPMKVSRKQGTPAGREIIAALTEGLEVIKAAGGSGGQRFTVRTVEMAANPLPYDGPAVRATRKLVGASQPVFAKLLGVSTVLVVSWEGGKRTPAPWARRLLDEVNRDPEHWRGMLRLQHPD